MAVVVTPETNPLADLLRRACDAGLLRTRADEEWARIISEWAQHWYMPSDDVRERTLARRDRSET